jgi:hypothetical protein
VARDSDLGFIAGAIVLHVIAVPVAAYIAPEPEARFAAAPTPPLEVEVEIGDDERAPRPIPFAVGPSGMPRYVGPQDPRRPRFQDPLRPPEPGEVEDPGIDAEGFDPDAPPGDYGRAPTRGEVDGAYAGVPGLGPGGIFPYLPPDTEPRPGAPTKAPRRKYDPTRATRVLEDGQLARDKGLGLDFPGGSAIKSIVISAVRASDAPFVSSGSFTISIDGGGKVRDVRLGGHSGGGAAVWSAIAKSVKAQLKARTFPLKSAFRKGALVALTVRSVERTPGGGLTRDGATVGFDVTDIGAKETRHVSIAGFSVSPVR